MPEGTILYWYGYLSSGLENCSSANGWTLSSSSGSYQTPVYNTNNITLPSAYSGIGTTSLVSASKIMMITNPSVASQSGFAYEFTTKVFNMSQTPLKYVDGTTGNHYVEHSGTVSSSYIAYLNSATTNILSALWYE